MDKMAIKVTLTSVTAPTLLPYLNSIEDSKQRAYALRHMAELGYACFLARQAPHATAGAGATWAQTSLASSAITPRPAEPEDRPDATASALLPGATDAEVDTAAAQPGALPADMADHLNDAMSRFFPS